MRDLLAGSSDGSSSSSSTAAAMTAAGDNKADTVAVKVLPPRQCTAAEFVRELDVLAHCRHKHLVALKVGQLCVRGWVSGPAECLCSTQLSGSLQRYT